MKLLKRSPHSDTGPTRIGETDMQLANLIRDGDTQAFDALFLRYYTPLCHLAARMLKSVDASEDVVQDVFLRIWTGRANWVLNVSVRAFLERAVRNASIDSIRHASYVVRSSESDLGSGRGDMLAELDNRTALENAQEAISNLPEGSRTIFLLSRVDGMTYAQIAERLGISVKTVETQMGRALKELRKSIAEFAGI